MVLRDQFVVLILPTNSFSDERRQFDGEDHPVQVLDDRPRLGEFSQDIFTVRGADRFGGMLSHADELKLRRHERLLLHAVIANLLEVRFFFGQALLEFSGFLRFPGVFVLAKDVALLRKILLPPRDHLTVGAVGCIAFLDSRKLESLGAVGDDGLDVGSEDVLLHHGSVHVCNKCDDCYANAVGSELRHKRAGDALPLVPLILPLRGRRRNTIKRCHERPVQEREQYEPGDSKADAHFLAPGDAPPGQAGRHGRDSNDPEEEHARLAAQLLGMIVAMLEQRGGTPAVTGEPVTEAGIPQVAEPQPVAVHHVDDDRQRTHNQSKESQEFHGKAAFLQKTEYRWKRSLFRRGNSLKDQNEFYIKKYHLSMVYVGSRNEKARRGGGLGPTSGDVRTDDCLPATCTRTCRAADGLPSSVSPRCSQACSHAAGLAELAWRGPRELAPPSSTGR